MVKVYGKDGDIICYWPPYTEDELRMFEGALGPPITVIRQTPQAKPAASPSPKAEEQ